MKGIEYSSLNFNPDDGVLVVPLDLQFYNGFYNKDLFTKAGITSFPKTWDELFTACDKLKAIGVTPFTYGTGGQALGGGFYPWYDVSYLMMYLQPADWTKLYNGPDPVDRPGRPGPVRQVGLPVHQGLHEQGRPHEPGLRSTSSRPARPR